MMIRCMFLICLFCIVSNQALGASFPLLQDAEKTESAQKGADEENSTTDAKSDNKKDEIKSIEDFANEMLSHDGYFPFYWDKSKGKVYLEIPKLGEEFLYVHSLATGLGSNPVGLDRGQLGDQKVVRFERVGPKVLLLQRNLRFRAETDNELEQRAVEQSFAQSVIWGGEVVAEEGERILVDITDLLISDVHGVTSKLKSSSQGTYSLDKKRSAVYLPRCKAFPKNTELEATLTFSGSSPGRYVRQTTPTPKSMTLRQHHSFVELPDEEYQAREYDVRSPCMTITYADYASPLDQPLEKRMILRHRLKKANPENAVSAAVEPIVYYVDAGAPKQIQQALLEGASWWNDAFESAGFKNAFQVQLLPGDADPLDVRYNVIQWVHRSTRGWSYGGSVIDPRTGEIIKGHVTLGSLRVRQDQLLVNALSNAPGLQCACCGIGGIAEESTMADLAGTDVLQVALARIRQLSAHEVGHTLGFVHNFAASTYADRASVMDYPAPRIRISNDGKLDFSDAYGVGIGEWDKVSVQFAYSEVKDEKKELDELLTKAADDGMIFISDSDARPSGAAHPLANLWDNGSDPIQELKHVMKVRKIALENFNANELPTSTTSADVAQYFTPLYLHHRYQLQATGKLVGGVYYDYSYTDDLQPNTVVPAAIQELAVRQLLETIEPVNLRVDDNLLLQISPRPYSSIRDAEILPTWSGRMFDPMSAAKVAMELTLAELLQPQRLGRLAHQSKLNNEIYHPKKLILKIVTHFWDRDVNAQNKPYLDLIKEATTDRLIELTDDSSVSTHVRDSAHYGLKQILIRESSGNSTAAYRSTLYRKISLFLDRPTSVMPSPTNPETPPGSPIGSNSIR